MSARVASVVAVAAEHSAGPRPSPPGELAAQEAGLQYVTDERPGLSRLKRGHGFSYRDEHGAPVRDAKTLERIRALVIPPAWTHVWICPSPRGHIQASGRDARGRKQYRYHPQWQLFRDETKYERMLEFAQALPKLRARLAGHLRQPGLSREKVLATVVRLLDRTLIRVGNEEYAASNQSYGLTTLRNGHVRVVGATMKFDFRGKSGKWHHIELEDRKVARVVAKCQHLPGQSLFEYRDGDEIRAVRSTDVNEYLQELTGQAFTAKDFRTWHGTVEALWHLKRAPQFASEREAKRSLKEVVGEVAQVLGNTPAVCRKSYIHPAVVDSFMAKRLCRLREKSKEALALELLKRPARPVVKAAS